MPKKETKKKTEAPYKLTLKVNDKLLSGEGKDFEECIQVINKDLPPIFKSMGVLTLTKNGVSNSMLINILRIKRLFINKTFRAIIEKQLTTTL